MPCSARIASAARSPSSVWVGGIRMSMIATSGRARGPRQELVRVAGLGDDLEPGLDRAGERSLPGGEASRRPGRFGASCSGTSARIAAPESSSFGMNPRTRLSARRGP